MAALEVPDLPSYLDLLRTDPSEYHDLLDALCISVSCFFRDPIVFETLAQIAIPDVIAAACRRPDTRVRAWSAGCASGEEAYSLAIMLSDATTSPGSPVRPIAFATDIDDIALGIARAGRYREQSLRETRLGVIQRHFVKDGDVYEVSPTIRQMVRFSREDLLAPRGPAPAESVYGGFDIVLCRNVLIYMSPNTQECVLNGLIATLRPGGYLVLGAAETPVGSPARNLITVDALNKIYQKAT